MQDYNSLPQFPSPLLTAEVANYYLPVVIALTLSSLRRLAGFSVVQIILLGSVGDFS